MAYKNIREEELKNKVAQDYFWKYDCSKIIGNVDFCVCMIQSDKELFEREFLLWAEAKTGSSDLYKSLVQLILTIGKARTFDKYLPPHFLGAFDYEKIAFIPYNQIHDIFYQNDFNWNVAPSNHETKEFAFVYEKVKSIFEHETLLFKYDRDEKELEKFIKNNFIVGRFGVTKIQIDKNNFMVIYNKWLQAVKPSIAVNWDIAKKTGIIDGDFYLADLLSQENSTLKEKLFVLLKKDHYELDRKIDEAGMFSSKRTDFKDNQKAHTQFWNKYERPPKEIYWDYIVDRRDLLVPQDIRERKGSFYTPQIWVELSQKYLADVLGEDWQDEYYVWDCAAGTGNLLNGLTNKYNIWASTLDQQDVEVMKDRIKNGANLLEDHVFQFDFLNDEFSKLPKPLLDIINNPKKRKKLVVYINPPYKRGLGVANTKWHLDEIGAAKDELFAQFLFRIYSEIKGALIGEFSKLKVLQAPNFKTFRKLFNVKLEKMFIVPADTFDNVDGKFPIGFKIWNTSINDIFKIIKSDIFDKKGNFFGQKEFFNYSDYKLINEWINCFSDNKKTDDTIGFINSKCNDFQHQNRVVVGFENVLSAGDFHKTISQKNIIEISIYYTIRKCIDQTWLNDRDQFLYPNDGWKTDLEFQNDCLTYTLFNNNIQSKYGTNHWIPFTEYEVGAREKFESDFMIKFIKGKQKPSIVSEALFSYGGTQSGEKERTEPLKFSPEAKAVFDAGRELWRYYHSKPNVNVNASLYDIREYFQGRNEKGKMNNKSDDERYNELISALRSKLKLLAKKIEPKVYEYGFLKA